MFTALIVGKNDETLQKLSSGLTAEGFQCVFVPPAPVEKEEDASSTANVLFLVWDNPIASQENMRQVRDLNREMHLPVIALASRDMLDSLKTEPGIDDFMVAPWNAAELAVRANRAIWRVANIDSDELIKCGDMVIDLSRCEVSIASQRVSLTYREYELLKFLASNRGRVFSREALLNKVWGYNYYGGDRTVDVHMRRLRSKLDISAETFIETVRNVGYRFKKTA